MESLEPSRLDSVLRKGLEAIGGLPESARYADENITRYLKQKFGELLVREYRRRSERREDEAVVAERTAQILDEAVQSAQKSYELFELQLKDQLGGFWEGLGLDGGARGRMRGSTEPTPEPPKAAFAGAYSTKPLPAQIGGRRFYCIEGCELEGELAYLAHRDRGHHPVPA